MPSSACVQSGLGYVGSDTDLGEALQRISGRKSLTFPDTAELARVMTDATLKRDRDQFNVKAALLVFERVARKEGSARLMALTSLMEALDAHLTERQLALGDRADILETVRWELSMLHETVAVTSTRRCCRSQFDAVGSSPNGKLGGRIRPRSRLLRDSSSRLDIRKPYQWTRSVGTGEAALVEAGHLDVFQGRFAEFVRTLAKVLQSHRRL